MFAEYEETLEDFLQALSTRDPDIFTDADWNLVRFYTRSDGCTKVSGLRVKACWEHDFYFRTHHDFCGHVITFWESNRRFRVRNQRLSWLGSLDPRGWWSWLGMLDPMSWWRWLGVTLLGHNAWVGMRRFSA